MNAVHLLGNTGIKPEVRFTATGKRLVKFTLATNRSWGKGDNNVTVTDWHNVECWVHAVIDVLEKWGYKGQRLQVSGRIQTEDYEDNGSTKYYTKIVADQVGIESWPELEPDITEDVNKTHPVDITVY